MRKIITIVVLMLAALGAQAQERRAQHTPYIDLRPLHFGIHVGLNMQDVEFQNIGPQTITPPEGVPFEGNVLCEADTWNPGFSVGVLADLRLSQHFSFRVSPTMHFGSKHLTFRNFNELNDKGLPTETTQDMKNTYISVPLSLKFAAQRFNNYRPYLTAGIAPMLNLSGKDQDNIQLKRFDAMLEVGFGCDFYLPFFKLIPELKFCYGLTNAFNRSHIAELRDANRLAAASSVSSARSKMVVLTFYFE